MGDTEDVCGMYRLYKGHPENYVEFDIKIMLV